MPATSNLRPLSVPQCPQIIYYERAGFYDLTVEMCHTEHVLNFTLKFSFSPLSVRNELSFLTADLVKLLAFEI